MKDLQFLAGKTVRCAIAYGEGGFTLHFTDGSHVIVYAHENDWGDVALFTEFCPSKGGSEK